VRISSAFVANSAEVKDGLAYVMGAFPEWWTLTELPADSTLAFVFVVEMDDWELGQQFQFLIRMDHPEQSSDTLAVIQYSRPADNQQTGTPIRQVVAVPVVAHFRSRGMHTFRVTHQENLVASVSLYVRTESPKIS
jgi:hypothetical protein